MIHSSRSHSLTDPWGKALRASGAVALTMAILALIALAPASAASRTERTFGKWVVVCIQPDNEAKRCSMTQSLVRTNRQTNRRRLVLRWRISIDKEREQTQALIVPTGVSVKEGVRLLLGDAEPIVIGYNICGRRVCVASAPLDAKVVAAVKASEKASASYVRGSKQLAQVQFDLNGFGQAYDFLVKQFS